MRVLAALVIVPLLLIAGCSDSKSPAGPTAEVALQVAPSQGTVITDFAFQASGSTTGTSALEFRWDWDGDGTWDTGWSPDTMMVHRFSEDGVTNVFVEVTDGSDTDADSVSVTVDGRHGHVDELFQLPVFAGGRGLAYDGTHIWVTNWGLPTYKLDAVTGDSLGSIPGNSQWTGGITWDGTYLWTVGYAGGMKLFKQNPATGSIVSSFPIVYSATASGLDWHDGLFYCGSSVSGTEGDGHIHIYDAGGTEMGSFPSPHDSEDPRGVAFDGVNAWVKIQGSDSLFVVDPEDGEVLRTLYVPGITGALEIIEGYVVAVVTGNPLRLRRIVP
jgi:hypothetical protein